MSEKETRVEPVRVTYTCDDCGVGEMEPTGTALMSNPPQYPHRCNRCGAHRTFLGIVYPLTRYRTPTQEGGDDE